MNKVKQNRLCNIVKIFFGNVFILKSSTCSELFNLSSEIALHNVPSTDENSLVRMYLLLFNTKHELAVKS